MLIMDGLALYSEPVVKWYHTHCGLATLMLCVEEEQILPELPCLGGMHVIPRYLY